jgi:hypothetical protein
VLDNGDAFAVKPGCMAAVALIAVVGEWLYVVSTGLIWIYGEFVKWRNVLKDNPRELWKWETNEVEDPRAIT